MYVNLKIKSKFKSLMLLHHRNKAKAEQNNVALGVIQTVTLVLLSEDTQINKELTKL